MSSSICEPVDLGRLGKELQEIRNELREIKFGAAHDRRTARSQCDNLAATNASQLAEIDADLARRLDAIETQLGDRFGHLDDRIGQLDERIGGLEAHIWRNAQ